MATKLELANLGTWTFTVSGDFETEVESMELRHFSPREMEDFARDELAWHAASINRLTAASQAGSPLQWKAAYEGLAVGLIELVDRLAVRPDTLAKNEPAPASVVVRKFLKSNYINELQRLYAAIISNGNMASDGDTGGLPDPESLDGKSEAELLRLGGDSAQTARAPSTSRTGSRKATPSDTSEPSEESE